MTTLAIVGAGLAGAKAAEAARQHGYSGRIILLGEEAAAPYERPPLSKALLRGEAEPDSARVHPVARTAESTFPARSWAGSITCARWRTPCACGMRSAG